MNSNRSIARAVGLLFLAGMLAGIVGNILIQSVTGAPDFLSTVSANSMKLAIGAMLLLLTVAGDAAHGILMFPVLKQHSERSAVGYLGFRIVNALFLGIQVLFVLLLIPLGSEYASTAPADTAYLRTLGNLSIQTNLYAYQLGMIFVGLAGTILCHMLYRSKLLPKFLAAWGLVGYVTMLCGSVLEAMGVNLQLIHTIPGGLWEIFIGVWLVVKGFNSVSDASAVAGVGAVRDKA